MSTNPLSIYCQWNKSKIWLWWHHPSSTDSVVSSRSISCVSSCDDKVTKILWITDSCFLMAFPLEFIFFIRQSLLLWISYQIPFAFDYLHHFPRTIDHMWICVIGKTSNGNICYDTICSTHESWISTCGSRDVVNVVNIHGLLVLFILTQFMSAALSQRNAFLC